MLWRDLYREAVLSIKRNFLRSFLAALGVCFGTASVIAMLALGAGACETTMAKIQGLGVNMLGLSVRPLKKDGVNNSQESRHPLKEQDYLSIAKGVNGLQAVSPLLCEDIFAIYRQRSMGTSVLGVGLQYLQVRNYSVVEGRFFTEGEIRASSKVVVLGHVVKEALFKKSENCLGATIRINHLPFKVIGVMRAKEELGGGLAALEGDSVWIPYTTAMYRLLNDRKFRQVQMSAISSAQIGSVAEEVSSLMRERHKLREDQDDDFHVIIFRDLWKVSEDSAMDFARLLAGLAAVSLLVGGIGIMNVMLVSLAQRVPEIGLRKTLGARNSDILWQFLAEATIISAVGGLSGVVLALIGVKVASFFVKSPMPIYLSAVGLGFGFSVICGALFGVYPAYLASRLEPIEALNS